MEETNVVILAAGRGSRMQSRNPNHSKVAYPILDKPIINYVLDTVKTLNPTNVVVVVGYGGEVTKSLVEKDALVVWQHVINGTGGAVLQAKPLLKDKKGTTLVVYGDTPLITSEMLENIFAYHVKNNNDLTIVTMVLENPTGYGRIIREYKSNKILSIREDKDCADDEKEITEVNTGVCVVDNEKLFQYLEKITPNNAQHECYLSNIVELFVEDDLKVGTFVCEDAEEMFSINDQFQLSYATKVMRKRINNKLMLSGVSIEDPDTAYISPGIIIGKDTIIKPNTTITGTTIIGENNVIGPNTYIKNTKIGSDNIIHSSWIVDDEIGNKQKLFDYRKFE